ncbi:MAG: carbohydrate-binding domain-containing protein [Clostridia bacterium]|nr:carbohydrate-binding domain-containing protein [Clostridia bacterium]
MKLILKNAAVSSSDGAPIRAVSAAEVTVSAEENTYNTVSDKRTGGAAAAAEDEENDDGAIWAACDLKISGKGTLIVESSYDNGIKSKDDLTIKNVTLKVTAPGNALKGNDSVTVKSGTLILISTASDGVKTSNSDVSSKGKQRGTVTFCGGQTDIYAAQDGISAAYDVVISEDEGACKLGIYTASYSDKVNAAEAASDLYLIVPSSVYSTSKDFYAYFYNEESDGTWVRCVYSTMIRSGRTSYYGLLVKAPAGYQNVLFNILPSGTAPDGSNYTAATGGETVNTAMNGYLITSVSLSKISGDWVQLSSGSGSEKTTYSSKGIKAQNDITVSAGTVSVYAMDDGLHANAGEELENGKKSTGCITVTGGRITVTSADDGMHADGELTISGGEVTVAEAHEGLEGNVITIAGGTVSVYGKDDGLNACKGSKTPLINITGGYLEVTTPSGDTDAIDSNGNFTMSGGIALVRGGASNGGVAGSVDADGTVSVTGGTILAFGGICETPKSGSVNTYISSGTSFSAGSYTFTDASGSVILSFTLPASYSSVWIASDAMVLNGSYSLAKDGSAVLTWTQSSATVGSAGGSGFGGGPGGPGGFGGRR